MAHRAKYRLEEKMNVLNEYDRGKPTKIIAEQYKIPISTVLYFIRHRNRFETESISGYHDDELMSRMLAASPSGHKKNRFAKNSSENNECLPKAKKKKRKRESSLLVSPQENQDNQTGLDSEGTGNGIRIRKIPFDMKMKIIKAWEDRQGNDQASNPTAGLSMKKIAEYFGVSTRSVSRCIADREHLKSLMSMVSKVIDEVEDQAMVEAEESHHHHHHHNHSLPGPANVSIGTLDNGSERSMSTASQPLDDNISDDRSNSEDEPGITISVDQHYQNSVKAENLDEELVESVTVVFDKLKRIKKISQRLAPPLNNDAMKFAEAMIQTANSCVERILAGCGQQQQPQQQQQQEQTQSSLLD